MYSKRWEAISARIKGIADAAGVLAQFLQVHSGDSYGMQKAIGKECAEVLRSLRDFEQEFRSTLPQRVRQRINEFATNREPLFQGASQEGDKARAAIVLLSALRSELGFLFADEQELIRSKTERAFLHLQRVLAANERERDVWKKAHDSGEVACEKLGAAHLLWHGIFAFKVDGSGARTDLIAPEPPDLNQVIHVADGLVLTEWKVVSAKNASDKFAEALRQAELYRAGVLAGIELAGYRFLVGVSEHALPPAAIPGDLECNGAIHKHINIVVNPATPSVQARQETAPGS